MSLLAMKLANAVGGRMVTVPDVLRPICRRCSKHRSRFEFVGGPIVGYCWHCYQNHLEALRMLSGDPPKGCQECKLTVLEIDELSRRRGQADTRLVLEVKDGIYQVLCLDCDAVYQAKRADLYRNTPYGAAKKI